MSPRVLIAALVALVIAGAAMFALRPARGVPDDAPSQDDMASAIGSPVMELLYRGHVPGRSGDIMLVPAPHNYLYGQPDLTTLGTGEFQPGSSHPNPWNYLVHVPIVFWGPGYVPEGREVDRPVDIADIAPTYAAITGMDMPPTDGRAFPEIVSSAARGRPPAVVFTIVIDGGGWNALQEHPDAWPNLARLMRAGTLYTNATIGSAPAITGALHATFGTGDYPLDHGLPGNQMRDPEDDGDDGDPTIDTWLEEADPRFLRVPTQSELWDERNGNRPIVGTVSYEGWHLGMIGHGAYRDGADKDIAVLWDKENFEWEINERYFELPAYLRDTDIGTLERYEAALDPRDGVEDGLWYENDLELLRTEATRPGTPAFARFTGDAVVDVLRHEAWGADRLTDFFWVEMKMPDYAGHIWNVVSPEEEDVLAETDAQIGRFVAELDRKVGRGNYLVTVSADHGQQPVPEITGGWRINMAELTQDIEERFGADFVAKITPVDIYVDREVVDEEGIALGDVARYLGSYTIEDNIPEDAPGADRVPTARLDEKIFAGAFATDYLGSLTSDDIASFGDGDYPEGRLRSDDAE